MKCIITFLATLTLYTTAFAQTPGIRTPGIDHVGITVPKLAQAEAFFAPTFGCEALTHIGPFPLENSLADDRKTTVPARAESVEIAMLRCGSGANIELFEYSKPTGSTIIPNDEDIGATHIAFYTTDVAAGVAYLKSRGVTVLGQPVTMSEGDTAGETWVHFLSPWGSVIELVSYPHGKAYEKSTSIRLWNPEKPRM